MSEWNDFRDTIGNSATSAMPTSEPPVRVERLVRQSDRQSELKQGLLSIASWMQSRAAGPYDEKTTLTMLARKVKSLRVRVTAKSPLPNKERRHAGPSANSMKQDGNPALPDAIG